MVRSKVERPSDCRILHIIKANFPHRFGTKQRSPKSYQVSSIMVLRKTRTSSMKTYCRFVDRLTVLDFFFVGWTRIAIDAGSRAHITSVPLIKPTWHTEFCVATTGLADGGSLTRAYPQIAPFRAIPASPSVTKRPSRPKSKVRVVVVRNQFTNCGRRPFISLPSITARATSMLLGPVAKCITSLHTEKSISISFSPCTGVLSFLPGSCR